MRTRNRFFDLKKSLEVGLVMPSVRDATECLAACVPKITGPSCELLGPVLFVEDRIWRFRSSSDAKKFARQLEDYFRNFDPQYRITCLDANQTQSLQAQAV